MTVGTLLGQYDSADQFVMGYDASKGEYVDMIKAGIVDPLKAVWTAHTSKQENGTTMPTTNLKAQNVGNLRACLKR